jgi:DivIVA domain-containing protein
VVAVALDRQRIERKDFPIGRRGYDPDAVDAHLAALADEVDELKRSSRRRTETLAAAASEQVRAIVEAAETSAAEIQRQAEDEASEIRTEASTEARSTREQATSQAREYVGKVSESTGGMLQRLEAMESELGALIEALKTGGNRLNADLQLLETNLEEVQDAVNPRPRFQPEAQTSSHVAPSRSSSADPATFPAEAESEKHHGDALESGQAAHGGSATNGAEDENARLIALNMALNGSSRDETERYLTENFRLRDQRGLLDEVYASVGA